MMNKLNCVKVILEKIGSCEIINIEDDADVSAYKIAKGLDYFEILDYFDFFIFYEKIKREFIIFEYYDFIINYL
jgi:hypothetical protein